MIESTIICKSKTNYLKKSEIIFYEKTGEKTGDYINRFLMQLYLSLLNVIRHFNY